MRPERIDPVLIGAGQFTHRSSSFDPSVSPASLMAEAITLAWADAGVPMPTRIPSLRAVPPLIDRPGNPAQVVAARLGITADEVAMTTVGGNSPQSLVNATCAQIAAGELDLAVLVGAEARRTLSLAKRAGAHPQWPRGEGQPTILGKELPLSTETEIGRGLFLPVQIYALFESAIRAAAGRTPSEHLAVISELWSQFSAVAASNPHAWIRDAKSAAEIRTPSPSNRLVGLPYTKLMNANNDVDMAAAVIVCSAERAAALGVAKDRWVFPHAGAESHEHPYISNRWTYSQTPAIRLGAAMALELAGTTIDEIELVDLYSCFPSAVQLGAASVGLPLDRQLTRTGGLTFAGGPGNNYPMHAIATIVGELRAGLGERAFVWANGGYVTKHSFGVYATRPGAHGFRVDSPQAEVDALPHRQLAVGDQAAGSATVEAYTVMHTPGPLGEAQPVQVFAACLLPDGRRAWGTSTDRDAAAQWCDGEHVGQRVTLDAEGRLH